MIDEKPEKPVDTSINTDKHLDIINSISFNKTVIYVLVLGGNILGAYSSFDQAVLNKNRCGKVFFLAKIVPIVLDMDINLEKETIH